MKLKGVTTYIYGLYRNNELIYIGKSRTPYSRQLGHKQNIEFDYCKILDKFNDREHYWMMKSLIEGHKLLNKTLTQPPTENWKVGDIVYFTN